MKSRHYYKKLLKELKKKKIPPSKIHYVEKKIIDSIHNLQKDCKVDLNISLNQFIKARR